MKNVLVILFILGIKGLLFAQNNGFVRQPLDLYNPTYGSDNNEFIREADGYLDRYDLIKALEYLNLAVDASNSNPTAYLKRALVQQQLGNESDAAIDFQMANRLNPFIADLMGYNGKSGTINVLAFEPDSYYSDIDWIGRLEYYLELVTKEETHQDLSFDEIVLAEEVILAYEQQDLSDARNKIDSLLELFPNSYLGHDLKGIYYFESENYEVASALFEKSVEINPSFAIGWYNLGLIAQKEGKAVEAIQHFEKATELQADLSKAYFNKALAFKKIGEREQAIKEYDKILEMDGQNHLEALINRGLTKKMLGDFNGSLADFDKALEIDPDNASIYKNRANLYFIFEFLPAAVADYTKAIELDEEFAEAYFNRGLAYIKFERQDIGCLDLRTSQKLGFQKAIDRIQYFCRD